MRWAAVIAGLAMWLVATPAFAQEVPAEGYAPDVQTTPKVGFRADFRAGWNLTDGSGVIDFIGLAGSVAPVFGEACMGCGPTLAPFLSATAGIAEEGRPSLRVVGGLEIAIGLAKDVQLVPSLFGGVFKAFDDDKRVGPCGGASVALRILGPDNFFFSVEPVSFVMLPPPPDGFTRYTTHFTLDMGIVRFGGIL